MRKTLSLILAVIMLTALPLSALADVAEWEADTENSFSVDFSDLSSYVGQNVTASNIETILGSGWSIYNPDNTDVSTTFNIGQQTSATYNKDHTIEIKRTHDNGQYYVIGLKKEFSNALDGKAKLTFETVSDLNTNIYVYDADGSVLVRLRYHQNAIKLTTAANGTETAICSVTFANSILTWELDFDLEAGTMGLTITTSQAYSTAPSNAASNLDTSVSKTIKTTTPFTVSDSATDIKSFVIGTNTYNYRARVMEIAVEAQKKVVIETPVAPEGPDVIEGDTFDGNKLIGWETFLETDATGEVKLSDTNVVSGNSLMVSNSSSTNKVVAAEKTFATPYTGDVMIETSFKGNRYTGIELFGDASIFRLYFDASTAIIRWQNSNDTLVALTNHAFSSNRLYKLNFVMHPVEGTMDVTITYSISDGEKGNAVTTHEAFSATEDGNTVVVKSKRPIKIGGPGGKNLSINKVQLQMRRPNGSNTAFAYFDNFVVKSVNNKALDVRTGVLKDSEGDAVNAIPASQTAVDYTYTMSIKNSDAAKDINVFVVHYASNGSMKKAAVNTKNIVLDATGEAAQISVPISITPATGDKVRIFAMDSSLVPIFDTYYYTVQ